MVTLSQLEKDCELLENVQKRCVKMMSDVQGETYEEKLKDAGLQLLKERREKGGCDRDV